MSKGSIRNNYLTIKEWAECDQPREKLIRNGCTSLTDAELLGILIGSGSHNLSAIELAKQILRKFDNDLNNLAKCSINDLLNFKGVGIAKAVIIMGAIELSRRRETGVIKNDPIINSSFLAYTHIKPVLKDKEIEEFWVILLNNTHKYIKKKKVSLGGISMTFVDPKVIFKEALLNGAVNIILVQNHPSGKINPSKADIELTNKLKLGARLLDINISDHIIFSDNSYFSFADSNLL